MAPIPANETPAEARKRTQIAASQKVANRQAGIPDNMATQVVNPNAPAGTSSFDTTPLNLGRAPSSVTGNAPTPQVAPVQPSAPTPQQIITPVAPVAPTIQAPAGETPEQARARTTATAAQNIAERQNITEQPEVKVEKPKVNKAEAPVVDFNASTGRESEIQKNLQEGLATNPSLFKDRASYNKAYGYDTADEGKKAIMDSFFSSNAQNIGTKEGIFDLLLTGQQNIDANTKNTPEYIQAKARYDAIAPLKGATVTSLYNAMVGGKLSPESTAYQDLVKVSGGETPDMIEAKKKYETKKKIDSINRKAEINYSASTGKTVSTPVNPLETVSNDILSGKTLDYAEEFKKEVSQNPELVKMSRELTTVSNNILDLEDQKKKTMENIAKQYPGITTGAATLLANQQNEAIDEELDKLYNKQSVGTANLNYQTGLAEKMFDYKVKQAETERQSAETKAASETAFQRSKELADYQSQLALTTDQAKFEQGLKQQEAAASDPTTAIGSIMEQYAKLGVPFTESLATKVANFRESGQTIGDYTKQMIKDIQNKPEYKKFLKQQFPDATEASKVTYGKVGTDTAGNDVYGFINTSTQTVTPFTGTSATGDLRSYASQYPNEASLKNNNPAGITYNSTFAKTLENAGIKFTKGTNRPAAEGGAYFSFPTIEEGFKAYDLLWASPSYQNLTVGAALNRWGTGSLPGVDTTKKVSELTDTERKSLQMAQIKKESPGMYKVLNSMNTGATTPASTDAQNYFNLITKGTLSYDDVFKKLGSSKVGQATISELNKIISDNGGTIPAPENSPQVKKMDDAIDRLKKLSDNPEIVEDISGFLQFSPLDSITGKKKDALTDIQFILDGNVLQNLIDAKANGATFGALSEAELKMLQSSANALSAMAEKDDKGNIVGFNGSEGKVKEEIKKLLELYQEKKSKMTNSSISTTTSTTQTSGGRWQASTGTGATASTGRYNQQ